MADYSLLFDGVQNYVSLGTMGNFGSNLGNGFYCSFQIKTTSTASKFVGFQQNNLTVSFAFNIKSNGGANTNSIYFKFGDTGGRFLQAGIDSPTINFTNGNIHTIAFSVNFVTNTITATIDGVSQTITYNLQQTLSTFTNFTQPFYIGVYNNNGTPGNFFACTLDNFQIGTSSSVLYGSYSMNDGPGSTTIADSSGNGNTGTLTGSPLPTWVTGLNAYGNVTGNFTFNGNLSLTNL